MRLIFLKSNIGPAVEALRKHGIEPRLQPAYSGEFELAVRLAEFDRATELLKNTGIEVARTR